MRPQAAEVGGPRLLSFSCSVQPVVIARQGNPLRTFLDPLSFDRSTTASASARKSRSSILTVSRYADIAEFSAVIEAI